MHYVVTGSLGHTGKPVTEGLLAAGHTVTVVTSKAEKAAAIEALGAKAAVGSVEDAEFVKQTFAGADAVYLMIPAKWGVTNWRAFQNRIIDNYVAGITAQGINKVVLLSSIGAHMGNGAGPVDGLYDAEQKLNALPGLNAVYLRPSYFYYNLFNMIGMVKGMGIMGSNFGDDTIVLTHTDDIADVALDKLLDVTLTGKQVQYIASDERTGAEIARILGAAVGKPETPWVVFSDEQNTQGMLQAGLNEEMATQYTHLGHAMRTGAMQADFFKNRPESGKIKLEQFAGQEFAPAFNG
jgi:uncharacterized protein YbjT (DUF2867 family)